MEARTSFISGVVQRNTLLRIPYFQRRYVWEKPDWERFAEDMEGTLDSERSYFLGAIMLKEEKVSMQDRRDGISARQQVVDGQQRLTTLSIYMKVLHMLASKNNDFTNQYLQASSNQEPVLIHCHEDKRVFNEIVHMEHPTPYDSDSNIAKAYNFFVEYLKERRNAGVNLLDLLNTVNASVTFVVISLSQDDDEQQIFDTINSLGVPLTTGELMKNFLYGPEDEQAYNENWKPMFDVDDAQKFWGTDASKTRQSKTKDNSTIERFFHAFVRVKMWDFKDRSEMTMARRKMFVKSENVFSTCKSFVEIFGMDKQELATEIIEYARLFKKYLNVQVLDERVPRTGGIKRIACIINALNSTTLTPYVLYILNNVKDEADRNEIFTYLEKYLVRRMMTNMSSKNYSDLFAENLIGQKIDTVDKLSEYLGGKDKDLSLSMPDNAKIAFGCNSVKFAEKNVRLVYYLYETSLVGSDSKIEGYNSCMALQLMPKPCTDANQNWPKCANNDDEVQRQDLIDTIGNFYLLDTNTNSPKKVQNKTLAEKLPVFLKAGENFRSSKQKLENLTAWTQQDIMQRNTGLVNILINNIWPL